MPSSKLTLMPRGRFKKGTVRPNPIMSGQNNVDDLAPITTIMPITRNIAKGSDDLFMVTLSKNPE